MTLFFSNKNKDYFFLHKFNHTPLIRINNTPPIMYKNIQKPIKREKNPDCGQFTKDPSEL